MPLHIGYPSDHYSRSVQRRAPRATFRRKRRRFPRRRLAPRELNASQRTLILGVICGRRKLTPVTGASTSQQLVIPHRRYRDSNGCYVFPASAVRSIIRARRGLVPGGRACIAIGILSVMGVTLLLARRSLREGEWDAKIGRIVSCPEDEEPGRRKRGARPRFVADRRRAA